MKKICIPVLTKDYPNYLNALRHLNVEPILVFEPVDPKDFDGLLLPGGDDINPKYYHQDNQGSEDIDDALDELQFEVLDRFVKAKKPIMGICRGHQVLNVYFNGTLIQDIKEKKQHKQIERGVDNINNIISEDNSFIYDIYGKNFKTNSSHHQAVDKVGENLKIAAYSDDGIVEALEHKTLPIISVQFHPERMCFEKTNPQTVDGSKIINYFLNM